MPFDEDTSIAEIYLITQGILIPTAFRIDFSTTYDDSNGTFDLQGPSGVYTFTPNANYEGTTYIYVTATDGSNPSTIPLTLMLMTSLTLPLLEGNNSCFILQISRVILETIPVGVWN